MDTFVICFSLILLSVVVFLDAISVLNIFFEFEKVKVKRRKFKKVIKQSEVDSSDD